MIDWLMTNVFIGDWLVVAAFVILFPVMGVLVIILGERMNNPK